MNRFCDKTANAAGIRASYKFVKHKKCRTWEFLRQVVSEIADFGRIIWREYGPSKYKFSETEIKY